MYSSIEWRPSSSIDNLVQRSLIIRKIRRFFFDRNFLEVETPILSRASVTDIGLSSFQVDFTLAGGINSKLLYLMTSPEFHMKRLLAAGSGSIFQLFKSFRNEEIGRYHNPEFTMLEWYHLNYDIYDLMHEAYDLLEHIFNFNKSPEFISYRAVFNKYVGFDPLLSNREALYKFASECSLSDAISLNDDKNSILQLLFSVLVEPNLGQSIPIFVYHFPVEQAGLSRINIKDIRLAERFEIYYKGLELANGFYELLDHHEQRRRFLRDNEVRMKINLPPQVIDENLLSAMEFGLPDCSGIALGVDRLVMLALKADSLSDVIAFPLDRA
ncbi:elongation factor P--(R)-beta-lysine ligase [Blochmannia endosymbiont of Colobopsis nipponica]|uniref:elongation factor P--(R)-beta-lysine ligase n=1 Tax=Blochmannia endosymbiont of Colobopsis nipponica TaxID=2681987 RepID=UPI0017822DD7|nr:elongation factor P--(R)-beta-lysine ligase [Blochmannia endosymbiont of Colobopsis nipponica]QOI10780.1 elongation factor P--(R)-beta-lysine ligase [Blochmannia endosymbiont of Colobopsis nipponica]